jgi:hypothetical protein
MVNKNTIVHSQVTHHFRCGPVDRDNLQDVTDDVDTLGVRVNQGVRTSRNQLRRFCVEVLSNLVDGRRGRSQCTDELLPHLVNIARRREETVA